jgi:hypothetical protein
LSGSRPRLDRPQQVILIGSLWALCNLLFAALRLDQLVDLRAIQYFGVAHVLSENPQAVFESSLYLLVIAGFFYATVSRFHHVRKRGKAIGESLTIFVTWLIMQGILLACQYPGSETLSADAPALTEYRQIDARFAPLLLLTAISHVALIAIFTASVWQRKWHANNFGIHFLIGLPTVLAMLFMSIPPALIDLGNASWLFYLWFSSMPLTFAWSCATELRPPYLLKLS